MRIDRLGHRRGQRALLLGLRRRLGDDHLHRRRDLDQRRIAAGLLDLALEVGVVLAADLERRIGREDQLGPAGGEGHAAAALARLQQHRMALRRARHGERALRLEVLAAVVEPVDLVGIGEAAALLVDDQRIVFPAVPQAGDDLHELVGAVVAQVVLEMLLVAEVLGLRIVERGDDVPGDAAAGHQVERREQARDMERLVVGRRVGRAEAEPGGGRRPSPSARSVGSSFTQRMPLATVSRWSSP